MTPKRHPRCKKFKKRGVFLVTGANHQVFGIAFSLSLGVLFGFPFLVNPMANISAVILFVAAVSVGAIFPDIDHPRSRMGRMMWPVSLVVSKIFGHRGITHSLFGGSLVLWGASYLLGGLTIPWYGFALGYLSHLIGDMCTPAGCPVAWPIRYKFRLPFRVKTGSNSELWVVGGAIVMLAVVIVSKFPFPWF